MIRSRASGVVEHFTRPAMEGGGATENALKGFERRADANTFGGFELEFADRFLVIAAALFDDRDSLPDFATGLEIAQADNGIGQVAQVDRRLQGGDHAMLRHDEYG